MLNKKNITILFFLYLLYFMLSSIIVFNKPSEVSDDYISESNKKHFFSDSISSDQIKLIDNPMESGITILNMIETAEKSISVAYYSLEDDESTQIFFSSLLNAANRGVKVKIVTDDFLNDTKLKSRETVYMIKL